MTADQPDKPENAQPAPPPLSPLLELVTARLGALVFAHKSYRGDDRIHVDREKIIEAVKILRDDPALAFDMLIDVTAVDYYGQPDDFVLKQEVWDRNRAVTRRLPLRRNELTLPPRGAEPRFAVVYHLRSLKHLHRLRIKCRVPEDDPTIASVTSIWPGANWLERETYDLYGIRFQNHPDLRRVYLYDEFVGHPLRKDYHKLHEQPIEPYAGPGAKEPRRPH